MSAPTREGAPAATDSATARSLKDELSALKIDRKHRRSAATVADRPRADDEIATAPRARETPSRPRPPSRQRGGFGLRLLSLLLWLIPIGLIGGGGYFTYLQYTKAQPKLVVVVESVSSLTQGEAGRILTAKGYIRSFRQAEIGVKTPGRIAALHVKEGDRVNEGDPLAQLEHTELDAQLASRKLMLERSKLELKEAEVDYEYKLSKARRSERLRGLNQMSVDEAEQSISAARLAEKKLETLQAAINYQEASIHEIEVAVQDMTIFAPFDGTVVDKSAEVGETVMIGGLGGNSGRGSVVSLADLDDLEVETDIEERALGQLKDPKIDSDQKQEAEIQVLAFPDRRYMGVLDRVVPLGDRARGTVKVYVKIKNPDARLFPELVANVSFLREGTSPTTGAPQTSYYISPAALVEQGDQTFAWVLDPENVARKRPITAIKDGDRIRVETGLKANERVILDPDPKLTDGMLVSPAS